MVTIFVPDIPEFEPLLKGARLYPGCAVTGPVADYWQIEAESFVEFTRKGLGLGPALWNSALCGGFIGRIAEYSRDVMRIESEVTA